MQNKLTPKLKSYKEEFDFLNKKIGELNWELATIYYGKKAILGSEFEIIEDRLVNYIYSFETLIEEIKNEVRKANKII